MDQVHQNDLGSPVDRVEVLSQTMDALMSQRDTLIAAFDYALAMPPNRQDPARIEGLARDLDAFDLQLAALAGDIASMLACPVLQTFLAEP